MQEDAKIIEMFLARTEAAIVALAEKYGVVCKRIAHNILNNPSELFSSTEFDRLIGDLKEIYDYVIVDTPPVNLVSDTLAIAQKCDGLILIARASVTTYAAFKSSVATVKQLNINLLGTIINGSGAARKKYRSYYKYSRYGYSRYGYYK